MDIIATLSKELNIETQKLIDTIALMDEGNTIPFIARYRKEVTGSLDDTTLRTLEDRLTYLRNIEKRKQEVKDLIAAQDKLTPEIEKAIENAKTITEVDDIYRPFRPHRKTRASVAREKGLEPLAEAIMAQKDCYDPPLEVYAESFISEEKGVENAEQALAGACDIIAEDVSDNAEYRKALRRQTFDFGELFCKKAKEEDSVYAQYYEYNEPLKKIPAHRILAINRGEKEEYLKVTLTVGADIVLNYLFHCVVTNPESPANKYLSAAVIDSYERLISPSIEREIRSDMFDNACEGAIKLFADNLSHLLMQAPLKGKIVLAEGRIGHWTYRDIVEHGALGFITYDGHVNYADSDIDNRELRPQVCEGTSKLPGVNINVKSAVKIVESGAKTAKIVLDQDEYEGKSQNVVFDLPGEIEDTIVFTAHYDSTSLSQGSYDNMTGSVGLLAMAEHFKDAPHRYSLRFVLCGSEERGLLGSKAYVAAHEEELPKFALNINLDMIGSIMGKFIACCTCEADAVSYIKYMGFELGFPVATRQDVYSSDSTPFADKGVPAISFARIAPGNTATIHNRYDTPALLSGQRMVEDINFIQAFAARMANAVYLPIDKKMPDNMKEKLDKYLVRKR